jgi:hypothetical protein
MAAISAARLNQFQRHIDAWNKLEWIEASITVPYGMRPILSGGVYMTLRGGDATCVQVPSPIRGLPLRTWTLHGIDHRFFEIAFDPHSDLLVVMG